MFTRWRVRFQRACRPETMTWYISWRRRMLGWRKTRMLYGRDMLSGFISTRSWVCIWISVGLDSVMGFLRKWSLVCRRRLRIWWIWRRGLLQTLMRVEWWVTIGWEVLILLPTHFSGCRLRILLKLCVSLQMMSSVVRSVGVNSALWVSAKSPSFHLPFLCCIKNP